MRKKKKIKGSTIGLHLFWIIISVISLYPIVLILFNALASEAYVKNIGYVVWPKEISFEAFAYLFQAPWTMLRAFGVTAVHAVGGALFSTIIQAMLGYTLTRKDFALRKAVNVMLIVTMFFNAGLIPTYMVNTTVYHLENTWIIYVVSGSVSAFTVFVYRTFFNQIPASLVESAEIDGAGHMQILFKIIVPLSTPILATQFFLGMTGRWKDYTISLYYMTDSKMYNLEYYIQLILKDANVLQQSMESLGLSVDKVPIETMKFAVVIIALLPMILVFPFLQKYFNKGAMVGGVKG